MRDDEVDELLDRSLVGFDEDRLHFLGVSLFGDEFQSGGLFDRPDEIERLVARGDGGFRPLGFLVLRGPAEELALDFRLRDRLGEPQDVLHGPAFPLLVFHKLQGERLVLPSLEPELDSLLKSPAPTSESVDGVDELEEVGARLKGGGNRGKGGLSGRVVALGGGEREDEDRGVGLGGPPGLQHLDGLLDDFDTVLL